MTRKIANLPNLGPVTARQLAELDITNEPALRAIGAVVAWKQLRFRFDHAINVNCLYALEGALTGCDWRDLPAETISRLRAEAGLAPKLEKACPQRR